MELYIKDRLFFPQLLPQQNNFMDFALKNGIMKKVGISSEDQEYYEIVSDPQNNRITWNVEKDKEKPLVVEFSQDELKYIKKGCEQTADTIAPDDFWMLVERIYNAIG